MQSHVKHCLLSYSFCVSISSTYSAADRALVRSYRTSFLLLSGTIQTVQRRQQWEVSANWTEIRKLQLSVCRLMSGVIRAEMKKGITLEMWIEIVNCGGEKKMGVFQIKYIAEVLEMKWASSCKIERYRWTHFTHEQNSKSLYSKSSHRSLTMKYLRQHSSPFCGLMSFEHMYIHRIHYEFERVGVSELSLKQCMSCHFVTVPTLIAWW